MSEEGKTYYCHKHGLIKKVVEKHGVNYCASCFRISLQKSRASRSIQARASQGNKTIGRDTLILNICSATDCPSKRMGLCLIPKACYAMKAEKSYPTVLPYRRKQEADWDRMSAEEVALQLVKMAQTSTVRVTHVRFSEAGDFRSQADVDKMSEVARVLNRFKVRMYGYTARSDLDFSKCHENMVVNGSGFMVHNSFSAVSKAKLEEGDWVCKTDCRICDKCKDRNGLKINDLIK